MIHLLRSRATQQQVAEMLEVVPIYIKLAVDINREIIVGGGEVHADCELILLNDGSSSADIWGADWYPRTGKIEYESLINLKPRQNRSMHVLDEGVRSRLAEVIGEKLEGV
jgi:Protein of unknown function (DUF5674)